MEASCIKERLKGHCTNVLRLTAAHAVRSHKDVAERWLPRVHPFDTLRSSEHATCESLTPNQSNPVHKGRTI